MNAPMKAPTKPAIRRICTPARAARIGQLAGLGLSAPEIGEEIHASRGNVQKILWRLRINLVHKAPSQTAFTCVISKKSMEAAIALAEQLHHEPQWMLARLIEIVIEEKAIAENLLEGVEAK